MHDGIPQSIGEAWVALATELEQQLRESDPDARVEATIDPNGLLQLDVRTTPGQSAAARSLARRYEERARSTCERCGGRISTAGAGSTVTILCTHCTSKT